MISKFKEIYTDITGFDFTKENLSSRLREKVELRDFFVMLLLEHNVKRIDIINAMNKKPPFVVKVRQRHNDRYKLYSEYRQDYDDVRRIFNNQLKQWLCAQFVTALNAHVAGKNQRQWIALNVRAMDISHITMMET